MAPPGRVSPARLLWGAGVCALLGCVFLAVGIASVLHAIRGGVPMGIFTIVFSVALYGLGGLFVYGYAYLQRHPEKLPTKEAADWEEQRARTRIAKRYWPPLTAVGLILVSMYSFGRVTFTGHAAAGIAALVVAAGCLVLAYRHRT